MAERVGLEAEEITVRFGGATALDAVTVCAEPGRITSLIGPNGAGKTTFFNACTGVLRPAAGRVRVAGVDVTAEPVQRRAHLGVGRTFQRMELFDSMTVADNVAMGREALLAGPRPWRHLRTPRHERAEILESSAAAIDTCGLGRLANRPVRDLSTGQRRLVELARVVAGGFALLLLDEPSSGLDHTETRSFGDILTRLVQERGLGVLLVEHDMGLVMSISDHVYVLDFGQLIFSGSSLDAQASTVVREAYLGAASGAAS
jgi:ABC-type branched-subunit amino acid transport system ATPase component